jgi:hypothetical protein
MAYRRAVLQALGGFDVRFPRAYREDADLALRTRRAGHALRVGDRHVVHPVRPAPWAVSITRQRGNADDALMRRLHGRTWRAAADAPPGAFRDHLAVTTALVMALLGLVGRHRRTAAAAAATWLAGTARFAWRRVRPGPRTPAEVAAMVFTSLAIPPVAAWYRAIGAWRARGAQPWRAADLEARAPADPAEGPGPGDRRGPGVALVGR